MKYKYYLRDTKSPRKLENIVGKDDRAGKDSSKYYGRTRSQTFGFQRRMWGRQPLPNCPSLTFNNLLKKGHQSDSCAVPDSLSFPLPSSTHASRLLMGASHFRRLDLSLLPCSCLLFYR